MADIAQTTNSHTRPGNGAIRLDARYQVIYGDNRDIVPNIPDRSIDLVVTSPPYFQQREYSSPGLGNENTLDEYINNITETLRQIMRVMKPTGSFGKGYRIQHGR